VVAFANNKLKMGPHAGMQACARGDGDKGWAPRTGGRQKDQAARVIRVRSQGGSGGGTEVVRVTDADGQEASPHPVAAERGPAAKQGGNQHEDESVYLIAQDCRSDWKRLALLGWGPWSSAHFW
jgi:hypothetical protein